MAGRKPVAPDSSSAVGRFAAALRSRREAAGLSVEHAAGRVGVRPGTWYNWEAGRAWPPMSRLAAIVDALGCSAAQLINEAGR